jgi:hypothetical protein
MLDIEPSPLPFIGGGAVQLSPSAMLPSDIEVGTTTEVSRMPHDVIWSLQYCSFVGC